MARRKSHSLKRPKRPKVLTAKSIAAYDKAVSKYVSLKNALARAAAKLKSTAGAVRRKKRR